MYTVVVPTFNQAQALSVTLESLLAQDTRLAPEIIVVDNNSSDETKSFVRALEEKTSGRVRYVLEREPGASAARNAGTRVARGEIVAFVDDDELVHPGWLEAIDATYQSYPDAWCVGGKNVPRLPTIRPRWFGPDDHLLMIYLGLLDYGEGTVMIEYPDCLVGGNFSARKEALLRVGGFDARFGPGGKEGLLGGEEPELCHRVQRAGGQIYYCGQAVTTHRISEARLTKPFFRRRAYREGRAVALLAPQSAACRPASALLDEAYVMIKDWAKALAYSGWRPPRAFAHEIAALKRLGYLQQMLCG